MYVIGVALLFFLCNEQEHRRGKKIVWLVTEDTRLLHALEVEGLYCT